MAAVPMPIVMAMVAGVFLRFGTDLVHALRDDLAIAGPMVLAFLLASVWPRKLAAADHRRAAGRRRRRRAERPVRPRRRVPTQWLAAPVWQAPAWSVQAMVELVVPLAITVLVVQNGQGVAVLRAARHEPPINAVTIACGVWSLLAATVGAVSTCLTGPTNALLSASGERARQYTAGICCGLLAIGFGLFAPVFTRLMLAAPAAFIAVLAGWPCCACCRRPS